MKLACFNNSSDPNNTIDFGVGRTPVSRHIQLLFGIRLELFMTYPHWEYFLALEDDLIQCARFVEFSPTNYAVYSLEFARVLLASASEFDVVAKMLCNESDATTKVKNIDDYRQVILHGYPKFPTVEILIPRYGLSFKPWEDWQTQTNPNWWKAYNKVKHERDKYFSNATLENSLKSVAGLMCALMYYYQKTLGIEPSIDPAPRLLAPQWYGNYFPAEISWTFTLPK